MTTTYPKKITVEWINTELKKAFPNMYPSKAFLKEHYDIVNPYRTEINLYKVNCYKELNTYYKTGEVIMQGGCPAASLDAVAAKVGKTGLTPQEKVMLIAERLEELYDKVKPLDHDIIVYRGVKQGTIGQNVFTGDCIKTRLYSLDTHRFCDDPDLVDIKLYKDRKENSDPRQYVYETLGFTSTTTKIGTAMDFAAKGSGYDTIMALRLPAGTKFIMPVDSSGYDYEYELILFPQQNTFVINDAIKDVSNISLLYTGTFCNELNKYRPAGSPKLRELRVKMLAPGQWWGHQEKTRPLLTVHTTTCTFKNCQGYLHFCHPETGACIGDKAESVQAIQDWWREKNLKGKCTKEKVDKCVDKFTACNPRTGNCLEPKDIPGSGYWSYSGLINQQVLNWVAPETIIENQKPRYTCTKEKIEKCADQSKLCDIQFDDKCKNYSEDNLWNVNNALLKKDLENLVPTGKCTHANIMNAALWGGAFCDPETGNTLAISKQNKDAWNKMLAGQTQEAKQAWEAQKQVLEAQKQKAKKKITDKQKPRYKCTKEKIEQCADKGQLCHPVHKLQDCKPFTEQSFDEDLYYVNNVIDKEDLKKLKPYGKCTQSLLDQCTNWKEFCDADMGICLEFNTTNKTQVDKIHKELKKQKSTKPPKISDYLKMTVVELKAELKKRGLPVSGPKTTLVALLAADDAKNN